MKKEKAKKIILVVIIILLILLGGMVYAYFATDIFKTPKQLFVKYLANNITQLSEFNLEPYNETLKKMEENKTEIDLDISDKLTPQEINIKYVGDLKNEKESLVCEIKQDDEQVLQANLAVTNDTYGIYLKGLHDKYLALENRDLKKFLSNFINSEEIVNMLPDKITQLESFSEEENNKLNNIYLTYSKKFLDQFEDTIFTSENGIQVDVDGKTLKANKYSATTSTKKILEVFTNTMTDLLNDKEFIDLYNSKMNLGTNIEDLKSQINEFKNSLDNSHIVDSQIVISVYSADKRTIKTEVNIDNNTEVSEFLIKDNNNIVFKSTLQKSDKNKVGSEEKITITNNFSDNQGELIFEKNKTYNQDDVKALEEDSSHSADYNYYIGDYEDENVKMTLKSTKNNDNVTTNIDLGNKDYSVVMNIRFNSDIQIEELTDENALILNDYSKEDFNNLGQEIIQNLSKTIEENPNYYISEILMSMGFTSIEDLNSDENLVEDETTNIIEENTVETSVEPIENEENINNLGRKVDQAISEAIEKSLSDYHAKKEEDPDTIPDNFLTVDAIKLNCSEDMEIELIDGTTLKSVLEDKIFYTQININGDTWELVETKTLYSENGDLETAEPIE